MNEMEPNHLFSDVGNQAYELENLPSKASTSRMIGSLKRAFFVVFVFTVGLGVALSLSIFIAVVGVTDIKDKQEEVLNLLKEIKNYNSRGLPDASKMRDCLDWRRKDYTENGVYTIYPSNSPILEVYCDMKTDSGGWIVFQRRIDGSIDFFRNWTEYENGFGSKEYEFWLGNRHLHVLTSFYPSELRIDLEDWDGARRYAKYSTFKIGNSVSNYTLYVHGYSGNAGDGLALHNRLQFSTPDQDNTITHKDCANTYKGAWWFEKCSHASLNGEYINGGKTGHNRGINWQKWRGDYYSLKFSTMMFRRKF